MIKGIGTPGRIGITINGEYSGVGGKFPNQNKLSNRPIIDTTK